MKRTKNEFELETESVICMSPDKTHEVRVPAFPGPCDYIRVVWWENGSDCWECVYWNQDELQEDEDACALGAAMAAIKQVFEGTFNGGEYEPHGS